MAQNAASAGAGNYPETNGKPKPPPYSLKAIAAEAIGRKDAPAASAARAARGKPSSAERRRGAGKKGAKN